MIEVEVVCDLNFKTSGNLRVALTMITITSHRFQYGPSMSWCFIKSSTVQEVSQFFRRWMSETSVKLMYLGNSAMAVYMWFPFDVCMTLEPRCWDRVTRSWMDDFV